MLRFRPIGLERSGGPHPQDIGKVLWTVLGFSGLVAGGKEMDRVKEVGTQTCVAGGKMEQFLRWALQRGENQLRDDGKGNWESVDCEGSGATQAEMSNKQLPIGLLLEGRAGLKVKSWIPYSLG